MARARHCVGSRLDPQVLIRKRRGAGLIGIDHDQLRSLAPRRFDKWPQVNIVPVNICAPGDDQAGVHKVLGRRAELDAINAQQGRAAS